MPPSGWRGAGPGPGERPSIEVWLGDTLVGGAIGIGIGGVISGDSLFGRHQDAARVAVADMSARLEEAGGLPLLGHPAERIMLPSRPQPARRLLGPG